MADEAPSYELSALAKEWASKGRQGLSPATLKNLLSKQGERCALSGARMLFDRKLGTPEKGGLGVHPLYPAVDHIECGNRERGHQIICYALNDVKGHMPFECLEALKHTEPWKELMLRWNTLAQNEPFNREAFRKLISPNGNLRR